MNKNKTTLIVFAAIVILLLACVFWKHSESKIPESTTSAQSVTVSDNTLTPSRPADAGCAWKPFQDQALGINMLVENCSPQQYAYSVVSNSVEQQDVYTSPSSAPEKIIEVFTKSADQTIQDAIQAQFINTLPGSFSKTCVVVKSESTVSGVERYSIEPDAARKAILDKQANGDIPDYSECGAYALDTDSNTYFEYQPNNSDTKFMFINAGQDTPYFDADSIKLSN